MWLSCLWFSSLPQEVILQVPRSSPPLKNRKKIKHTPVVDEFIRHFLLFMLDNQAR